jgi:hypothetical protein
MKKIIILFTFFLTTVSCSEEDMYVCQDSSGYFVDCNINDQENNDGNNNNDSQFAESDFIVQTGAVTYRLGENSIKIPLRSKGIPLDVYRVDVVVFQNGEKLATPFIMERNDSSFFTDGFYEINSVELIPNSDLFIEMFVSITNQDRKLKDNLIIN